MTDFNGSTASILTTLGRLMERTETTVIRLNTIEAKVDLSAKEIERIKNGSTSSTAPIVERYVKRGLTFALPVAALWVTGFHREAGQLLRMFLGEQP